MADLPMQKLTTMGNLQPKPNNNPLQVVNVTYGHEGGGKLYSYLGQNKRAGDIVTPEVTHPKTGRNYKTLGVVRSTHQLKNGQSTLDFLNSKNMQLKTLDRTDQTSLPGYKDYEGKGGAKAWAADAKAAKELEREVRLDDSIPQMQKVSLYHEIKQLRRR